MLGNNLFKQINQVHNIYWILPIYKVQIKINKLAEMKDPTIGNIANNIVKSLYNDKW